MNDGKVFPVGCSTMNTHTSKTTRRMLCGWISTIFGVVAVASQIMAGETNNSSSYERGVANIKSKEWKKAISNFDEALHLNPKDALAYEYRGGAYFATGDFDNAINDFAQAIQLDPANARALCNRGSAYLAKNEFDKAMRDFSECVRLNPTNDAAYKGRAASYSAKGELDNEINDWNEGLRLNPNDPSALVMRGWAYFMTSQFHKAVQDYSEAIRLDPQNVTAYNNLGWLRATCPVAEMRNGKEAVEVATKACKLTNWKRWEWIDTLAAAFAEAGDFKNAVKYEKQAMDMNGVRDNDRKEMQRRLSLYEQQQPNHEGQKQ
jgi:tetratricopeptide (TPR) repeat protein